MLGIKQSRNYLIKKSLYQLTGLVSLCETIRERQLTDYCICMPTDEHVNLMERKGSKPTK